jgi:hypothetical protein
LHQKKTVTEVRFKEEEKQRNSINVWRPTARDTVFFVLNATSTQKGVRRRSLDILGTASIFPPSSALPLKVLSI